MSTQLISVVQWARRFISNMFLFVDGSIEPALTNANIILGTILGPPFTWEWNRNTTSFTCSQTTSTAPNTDYLEAVEDFGFIESGHLLIPSTATAEPGKIYQLQPRRCIEVTSDSGRPDKISVCLDDQSGNITFRLNMSPDALYTITVTYQKAFVPLTQAASVLPIPDKLLHIFRYGFLAMAFLYNQDKRFT